MWFRRKKTFPPNVLALAKGEKVLAYTRSQLGIIIATETGIAGDDFGINWSDMYQASFEPPVLNISYQLPSGNQKISLTLNADSDPNEFPNLVRSKITSIVVAQSQVEFQPGKSVIISARRKSKSELFFVVTADAGIDTTTDDYQQWARAQVSEFRETFGF